MGVAGEHLIEAQVVRLIEVMVEVEEARCLLLEEEVRDEKSFVWEEALMRQKDAKNLGEAVEPETTAPMVFLEATEGEGPHLLVGQNEYEIVLLLVRGGAVGRRLDLGLEVVPRFVAL